MISRIRLLRAIGKFESADAAAQVPLARLTIVYAENGQGKTTLSSVFRSLASGDPSLISERRRFGSAVEPQVVLVLGNDQTAVFENGAWSQTDSDVVVFDDAFVDANICSGLEVEPEHRQRLHELILGSRGVELGRTLQATVRQIEDHNSELRRRAGAIPSASLEGFSVEDFCGLPVRRNVDEEILQAERSLAATQQQASVRGEPAFQSISLPDDRTAEVSAAVLRGVESIGATAVARVKGHVAQLGQGGEAWLETGTRLDAPGGAQGLCPFCGLDTSGSSLVSHYSGFFSEEYREHVAGIATLLAQVERDFGPMALLEFERSARTLSDRRRFWADFADVPIAVVDLDSIASTWRELHECLTQALRLKLQSPLEIIPASPRLERCSQTWAEHTATVREVSAAFQAANFRVAVAKERAAAGDVRGAAANLARLKATQNRHSVEIAPLCQLWVEERAAKILTELHRDLTRSELDRYRTTVFPGYQTAINLYLERFNAGFRLDQVTAQTNRGGASCSYSVLINNRAVQVGGPIAIGQPSFRSTLSAGDRNTLALAFFFASLDQDARGGHKTVIIDDPVSSLDEHRTLTTIQELRSLANRVSQVIVLSHSKGFVANLWDGADRNLRAALRISRSGGGSAILSWDVTADLETEHDRRYELLRQHCDQGGANHRSVAEAIRPLLEGYLRVAFPGDFPSGSLIGPFLNICQQRLGGQRQVLDAGNIAELRNILEYANRFHHDTNAGGWQTAVINDVELSGFARRALRFISR